MVETNPLCDGPPGEAPVLLAPVSRIEEIADLDLENGRDLARLELPGADGSDGTEKRLDPKTAHHRFHHGQLVENGHSGGIEADFLASAKLEDRLTIRTTVMEVTRLKLILDQRVYPERTLLFRARVTIALVSLDGRPRRLPEQLTALGDLGALLVM